MRKVAAALICFKAGMLLAVQVLHWTMLAVLVFDCMMLTVLVLRLSS
jgi:hypothetical protein